MSEEGEYKLCFMRGDRYCVSSCGHRCQAYRDDPPHCTLLALAETVGRMLEHSVPLVNYTAFPSSAPPPEVK